MSAMFSTVNSLTPTIAFTWTLAGLHKSESRLTFASEGGGSTRSG